MSKPRSRWARVAGYVALWTAVTAFFAVQVRLQYVYLGEEIGWPAAFAVAGAEWYVWALLTPVLWWLARWLPFERRAWIRSALAHAAAIVGLALVATILENVLIDWIGIAPPRPPQLADLNAALLTAGLISGVCHALVHSRAAQDRRARAAELESLLTHARLDLLRSQLQPHFLFNTLNAVTTLMHRDVFAAETMLTRLADLLRLTLALRDRQQVTLREELEVADAYLAIQQTRFGDRLQVRRTVDPALYDALVPTMILQPLIENAVDHGIGKQNGPGRVSLDAVREDDDLRLTIRDDGAGLAADNPAEGIGLANSRERLAQLYGDTASLRIAPLGSGGVEVHVRLPLVLESAGAT